MLNYRVYEKIRFFKYCLDSLLFKLFNFSDYSPGLLVKQELSEEGNIIKIKENIFFKYLFIDNIIQSKMYKLDYGKMCFDIYLPLLDVFKLNLDISKVLLLGLGGGDIARYCLDNYENIDITVVEKSAIIIKLFHDFFAGKHEKSANLHILHADCNNLGADKYANIFGFDLIIFDCYIFLDSFFASGELFREVIFKKLKDNGIIYINLLTSQSQLYFKILTILKNNFQTNVITLHSKKSFNIILLAGNNLLDHYLANLNPKYYFREDSNLGAIINY